MTTWSGWMVGKFKIRHPEVYSVADVGYMLAGPFGREFIAVAYWLYMTCVVGSGLLSVSTPLCFPHKHSLTLPRSSYVPHYVPLPRNDVS